MADEQAGANPDLSLFYDVNMVLAVEIGRTQMKLRDVLNMNKGAVVELNKLAGDPLDILANGKLIAHGEIIAVNNKYGIRITQVVSKIERDNQVEG